MARWRIEREAGKRSDGLTVWYDNLDAGLWFKCGELGLDVPDDVVIDWIFDLGGIDPGDHIRLSDGSIMHYRPEPLAASA